MSASPRGGGGGQATGALVALAPAKVNLGLFLGAPRAADGRHELVSVMQSISLADELALQTAPAGAAADEVLCPGVDVGEGENLAAAALRAFRQASGWQAPPQRLSILKRIPGIPAQVHFFVFQPGALRVHLLLLAATAVIAALYPIRVVARLPIAATLRDEVVG